MKLLKIQFGCGSNILPEFENLDHECPIQKPLPYSDNMVDFVLAEHVTEHVAGPDALHFFEEVFRILKPGGVFRVCIPVLDRLDRSSAKDIIRHHGHLTIWNTALIPTVLWAAGFDIAKVAQTLRKECDGHFRVIGFEKDDRETARFEAIK